ncbi:hypothetical protein HYH02_010865 [Chlamydomonas schloesseri]|uniref:Uncharacterized protein n=1 Tax=Chlamydomonas schloesseri TaxID=2026947 RepID=A0A835TIL9_9CHLO|nr:hypothetical protein HYH02_010865 [Chlamydomonas schloesseri]|eukprot:KAG2438410.1 hypothetical protein HYH02_010865 [Chlamydomonas schloesseri]
MEQHSDQLAEQLQEQHRAELRRTMLGLGVPTRLLEPFTHAYSDIILRAGLKDLASFQEPGATPEAVADALQDAGLPPPHAAMIEILLERAVAEQEQRRAEPRRTMLGLGVPTRLLKPFTDANLDVILRSGLSCFPSFQQPGATPEAVADALQAAGLAPALVANIEELLECAAEAQQQQGRQESDDGGRGGGAATAPDTGHARDQQPTCGGPFITKGWWSTWLASAPLLWSTQPPQPQAPLPPGSTASPPDTVAVAAVAAAAAVQAASTAPTAEQRPVGDDAARSMLLAVTPTAPPASLHVSTCRRRHVHRPALGQG